MVTQENDVPGENERNIIGLRTAITILTGWKASPSQIQKILGISPHALDQANARNAPAKLDGEQLERISIVLNIHATLRTLFENPANLYEFMARPNGNAFFDGRAPLDVIAEDGMQGLVETHRHIEGLLNGMW
ncbi:MAG: antitoxin Xre/MbcA/ParS toxin-binding domain-containing protein [Halopseudomonas yangmingensis]